MKRYKPVILTIGILNLLAGFAAFFIGPFLFTLAATTALSWYCELDHKGVINQDKLTDLHGASFAADWTNVPRRMNGGLLDAATTVCAILSAALTLSGAALCTMCGLDSRRIRRQKARIARGHCPQCDYDLTGNDSGICPECGFRIEQSRIVVE